jgi:hypothetical protein
LRDRRPSAACGGGKPGSGGMISMSLDWGQIGAGHREPLVRPREIFSALPKRP